MIHVLKKQKHPPTPPGTHHPELLSRVFSDVKLAFLGTYTFEVDMLYYDGYNENSISQVLQNYFGRQNNLGT